MGDFFHGDNISMVCTVHMLRDANGDSDKEYSALMLLAKYCTVYT